MGPASASFSSRLPLLAVAALFAGHAALFGDYIADDAGISLAYGRNLAAGYGPVLYPGGEAVEGFSNPLWTAIITLAAALRLDGHDGIPLLKILGLLCGVAALWLTMLVARRAYPDDPAGSRWIGAAVLAGWTPFVFWSGAGLENPLYVVLLLLAALLQLREIDDPSARPWSAVALAGVALTRPEGCAFFLAFLVHRVITVRERWRLLAWTGIFVGMFAAFLALRLAIFGDWLPNTYHAKISDREITELWRYAFNPADPGVKYLQLFAVANLAVIVAAAVGLADFRHWRANLLLVAIGSGTAVYALYVGGDFWPAFRFLTPALPMLAIGAQHAIALLPIRTAIVQRTAGLTLVALVIYGSIGPSLQLRAQHREDTLISLQGRLEQGKRMRALATALGVKDPLYLDPDIGGPSVAGLRVLDLGGLTDIHVARFAWYPAFFRDYIFREQRPHIIRTHSTWTRTSQITKYPEFHAQYVAVHSYTDYFGLHGEFVRRDLLTSANEGAARIETPSFQQSVAAATARRAREHARERAGWIEYYSDRGWHDKLLTAFHEHERSGTLPGEPGRLHDLFYGLAGAGDRAAAERVRARAQMALPAPVVLREAGVPVLSLVAYRVLQRDASWARLQLVFDVLRTPSADFEVRLQLGEVHREHAPLPPTSSWTSGSMALVEVPLYVEPGAYEIRAELAAVGRAAQLCGGPTASTCQLQLGTYPIRRR